MAVGALTRGPGSTVDNNGYMAVPTSYNNNSDNSQSSAGSETRLLNETPTSSTATVGPRYSKFTKWSTLIMLFIINLINYMDCYTIVGVLSAVQVAFKIDKQEAALLTSVFLIFYMALSPLVGYLGDRFNRKIIIIVGLIFWTLVVLLSSFIEGKRENWYYFLASRAMVGIGEATYSCIAPTVITDLFDKDERNLVMAIFVIAIPLGSGLGFIASSSMVQLAAQLEWGGWEWSLRITPPIAVLCIILLTLIMPNNIPRGYSDGMITQPAAQETKSNYLDDIKYLIKNKSFVSITGGFTGVAFTMGCLSLWFPQFLALAYVCRGDVAPCLTDDCEYKTVMTTFGVLTAVAGLGGVAVGLFGSTAWKKDRGPGKPGNQRADAELCAIGQFVLAFFVFIALFAAQNYPILTWAAGLIGMIGGCINWALMVNMTMYTCLPKRRSTANALQMFTGHILGDAFSPFLVGMLAEKLEASKEGISGESFFAEFKALQYGMLLCPLLSALGGMCFLIAANYIVKDKAIVDEYVKNNSKGNAKLTESNEMVGTSESDASVANEHETR